MRSYYTSQFLLLANQRLLFLLLVDIGYSVILFDILVSDQLIFSFEMCITRTHPNNILP